MGFITNQNITNNRTYDSEKINVDNDLNINNSGSMHADIENHMSELAIAAHNTLANRKPIYDFKTSNESFLNLYKDYCKLGITNNKFFLKLYDKDLLKIDPFSPMLPLEVQMKVLLEVLINPWYFLREICRIPEDGAPIEIGGGSKFLIDRNSAASWYLFLNGVDHYDSKSRQLGKTQNDLAEMNYAFNFGSMSATFLFFNKDQPLAKQNLYRLKCQRDMMPAYLQMKIAIDGEGSILKETNNITTMRNPVTNNTIKVMPKAVSMDAAIKLGRGETAALHYLDEFDFTPWNTEIMKASSFSFARASENAAKNHSLFGRVLSSTPGYLSTREGKTAAKSIERMLKWEDKYLDMPMNQFKKILSSPTYNGIVYNEHTWKQLKKSMEWYEAQCKLVDYAEDNIMREIDLQRIQGNASSPFKKQDLVYITRNMKAPIDRLDISKNLCPICIYEPLNDKIAYMLAVDPSEGLGQNNNAFTLINPYTQCVAAEYKSPYISPPDFFRLICQFLDEKCPKTMIVVEANRGRELINRILESKYRYNLWYDEDKLNQKITEVSNEYGAQQQSAHERRAFGFDTTARTKGLMFTILENMVVEEKYKLYTEFIVKDINGISRTPAGKIILGTFDNSGEDEEGAPHGDNVMSFLIGLCVYLNASNLEKFGIKRGAKEPSLITQEDTDEEKILKMKSMMSMLPESLRDVFATVVNQKDDVKESWKYEKQIQDEIRLREMAASGGMINPTEQRFIPSEVLDKQWDTLSRDILDSNFKQPTDTFDISRYI